ncbi:hypothetical protein GALMADRAFT_238621 [Galerina marginata CBS 339.88]|uniref:Uncharacterized protein n=1 Tax=Galerina marginata (strain CBS 339.88) TaxID=685588 RepID=A0A067TKW2_GALM3|nr:hypothetical protein GALMADRAFT_238621 [Galerina marginata CBS 339.88]
MSEPVSNSKETATRASATPLGGHIIDPDTHDATSVPLPPSTNHIAREVDTAPQQGSTQPGDGGEVRASDLPSQPTEKVPFKERVIGVAQKSRGTLLGKPDLVEHGDKILKGETTHEQDRLK